MVSPAGLFRGEVRPSPRTVPHGKPGRTDSVRGKGLALEKAFPSSTKRTRCHERVFEEWETSPVQIHLLSDVPAAPDEYLTFLGGKDKALCLKCHAPHVNEFIAQASPFVAQVQSGGSNLRWGEVCPFGVGTSFSDALVAGPQPFLPGIEAESSKGAQDHAVQSISLVKRSVNIPIGK